MVNVSFPAPIDRENSKITASDTQEPIMVTLFCEPAEWENPWQCDIGFDRMDGSDTEGVRIPIEKRFDGIMNTEVLAAFPPQQFDILVQLLKTNPHAFLTQVVSILQTVRANTPSSSLPN